MNHSGERIPILVVGDWLVDEHWVVGKHRSFSSSRTGHDHSRALHQHACSVRSLCGAGQVATILHSARVDGQEFYVHGAGFWHPGEDETMALAAMIDPRNTCSDTPHTLVRKKHDVPANVELHNLVGATPLPPDKIGAARAINVGTTRVIRIYRSSGGDKPVLGQRIDWELPLSDRELRALQEDLENTLKPLHDAGVQHIVVKDLGRGVVCPELIDDLKAMFPSASWYVSSKKWRPEWLNNLPQESVRLFLVPQIAAKNAIFKESISWSWFTGDVPSLDALQEMDKLAHKFSQAKIVVLPQGMRVIARESEQCGFVMSNAGTAEILPLTPMASVFFPALVAQLARDPASDFSQMLASSIDFTEKWGAEEGKRIVVDDWEPSPAQQFISVHKDSKTFGKWSAWNWQDVMKDWRNSYEDLGIVEVSDSKGLLRQEFQLWRGMTAVEGYITCARWKRMQVMRLLNEAKGLVEAEPSDRRHKSFLIEDVPGSGKSYLVECLARTLKLKCLRFDVSQMVDRDDLPASFQTISSVQSDHPTGPLIVFFDEINTLINGTPVYGAFLKPLEDGQYIHDGKVFHLAPCLWIFAGVIDEKANKWPDFRSRLTCDPINLQGDQPSYPENVEIEQVYLGVAMTRSQFPDVNKISAKVLEAFKLLPRDTGARGIKRFVKSFRNIQYGRVMAANLPRKWWESMGVPKINLDNCKLWRKDQTDSPETLVDIKNDPGDYLRTRSGRPVVGKAG